MNASSDVSRSVSQPATRRYLTLLFSDLCDSTTLARQMEAEDYAEVLAQINQAWKDILPKHGGTIVRNQGDGLLAMFGHPDALEDDSKRATEAALELHSAIRAIQPRSPLPGSSLLRLHTGIHSGLVLIAKGDVTRGRFELQGPAPYVAAGLAKQAKADEILVTDASLGPERQLFVTGEPRSLKLESDARKKSQSDDLTQSQSDARDAPKESQNDAKRRLRDDPPTVRVLPILGRAEVGSRLSGIARRDQLPFVGRQVALSRLDDALRDARGGHARLMVIVAAAGLGKTRLAEEWLRQCSEAGCQVHRAYCETRFGTESSQPFAQILRGIFEVDFSASPRSIADRVDRRLREISPQLVRLRSAVLQAMAIDDPREDGSSRRRSSTPYAIPLVVHDLFAKLAEHQTQVLFIDDWQWADDATHQSLDAIRQLDSRSILILLAMRGPIPDAPAPDRLELLELQPLTQDESVHYIGKLVPGANPFLIDQIRHYAGGNPLFIEELCHCAADDFEVRRTGRLQRGAAWINVLIQSRVGRLRKQQAELVRSAAIIGNVIPTWLFESITGLAADHAITRSLQKLDLIFPGEQPGTLRFKHAIARDAIYDAVGLRDRQALHLRIAQALLHRSTVVPGEDTSEALAYHFEAAGSAQEAAHYAELAGDRAIANSALDRAQAQYRAALAALDGGQPSAELARRWNSISERLGLACVFNPARSDLPIFQRAVALAEQGGDVATIARATYWLAYIHYALGDTRQAVDLAEQALSAAKSAGDERLAVQVRATLGQAKTAASQYESALELLDEAIAIKRVHRSGAGQAVGLAYSLATRGWVLGDRGRFNEAHLCFDEAMSLVQGVRHQLLASIFGMRSAVLMWQGRWAEARDCASEAFRIGEQVRSLFTLSMGRAVVAYAEWMIESKVDALHDLQRATDWLAPRGITLFCSLNHGWLADGLADCHRRRDARLQVAHALRRWREQDLLGGAMACRAMARLESHEGRTENAQRWIERAREVANRRESAHERAVNDLCAGEIALAQGASARAGSLLSAAAAQFAALEMGWHRQRAERGLASL